MEGMNTKSIIMSVVAIAVAVLVVVTCAIPIFTSATETEKTFTNEGYFTMDNLDGDHTLYWDHAAPKSVTVDDNTIDLSGLDFSRAYTVLGGYNFMLRLSSGAIQLFAPSGSSTLFMQATVADSTDMTVTITGTSATFAVNSATPQSLTITLSDSYIINTDGNGAYTMKYADKGAYVTPDSSIIVLIGVSRTFSGNDAGIYAIGTVEDGLDFNVFRGNVPSITIGDPTYTTTAVSNFVDLYSLEKIEFTATQDNIDYDLTYSYFLVPTEVTAEKVIHPTDIQMTLISIIPILMVLGIIVAAVGMFLRSRAGTR